MRPETLHELAGAAGIEVPPIRGFGNFARVLGDVRGGVQRPDLARRARPADPRGRRGLGARRRDLGRARGVPPAPQRAPRAVRGHRSRSSSVPRPTRHARTTSASGSSSPPTGRSTRPTRSSRRRSRPSTPDRGVVGFGLANDETGHPPEPFADAFAIAREAGLLSVPHAGELDGPASVRGALDALGADRVQHGVRAIEDPELVRRLADSPVCLDVCPTSNVLLSVVPDIASHPLPALLAAGVRCSLNADDPLLFGPNLLAEYELARDELGLDDATLAHVATCSIDASAAPAAVKQRSRAGIAIWLDPVDLSQQERQRSASDRGTQRDQRGRDHFAGGAVDEADVGDVRAGQARERREHHLEQRLGERRREQPDLDGRVLHGAFARPRPRPRAAARGCPRSAARCARAPRRRASRRPPRPTRSPCSPRAPCRADRARTPPGCACRARRWWRPRRSSSPSPTATRRTAPGVIRPWRCTVTCTMSPSGISTTPSRTTTSDSSQRVITASAITRMRWRAVGRVEPQQHVGRRRGARASSCRAADRSGPRRRRRASARATRPHGRR